MSPINRTSCFYLVRTYYMVSVNTVSEFSKKYLYQRNSWSNWVFKKQSHFPAGSCTQETMLAWTDLFYCHRGRETSLSKVVESFNSSFDLTISFTSLSGSYYSCYNTQVNIWRVKKHKIVEFHTQYWCVQQAISSKKIYTEKKTEQKLGREV